MPPTEITDKCPACLTAEIINVGTKNDFIINRCKKCNTLFSNVVMENEKTSTEVKDLYDHYYDFANFNLNPAVENSLQKAVKTFEVFRQTGRILDIGFGEGGLLSVAEKNKWECYGTELSPQSLQYGTERKWKVSMDALNDITFPKNGFDVVTMVELIEHVPTPDSFFEMVFTMLRPGGLLYLTTPNMKSINRRWLGTDWSVISPPEHITIWSPSGLRKALARNNFATKKIRTEGFNPVEILARLRNKKRGTSDIAFNRNEAAYSLNEAFMTTRWRRGVKSTINKGLSTLRLGDGIKVWAVKRD